MLHARVVIPGHKPDEQTADSPDAIAFTRGYLEAFDAERARATTPDQLIAAMRQRYPALSEMGLLNFGARRAYMPPAAGGS